MKLNIHKAVYGIAAVTLFGCSAGEPSGAPTAQTPAPLSSGIDLEYMNTSVRPGDDFFAYVNGNWIDNT